MSHMHERLPSSLSEGSSTSTPAAGSDLSARRRIRARGAAPQVRRPRASHLSQDSDDNTHSRPPRPPAPRSKSWLK